MFKSYVGINVITCWFSVSAAGGLTECHRSCRIGLLPYVLCLCEFGMSGSGTCFCPKLQVRVFAVLYKWPGNSICNYKWCRKSNDIHTAWDISENNELLFSVPLSLLVFSRRPLLLSYSREVTLKKLIENSHLSNVLIYLLGFNFWWIDLSFIQSNLYF